MQKQIKPEVEAILLEADTADLPTDSEFSNLQAQLAMLQSRMSNALGQDVTLDLNFQDAAFFATMLLQRPNDDFVSFALNYTFSLFDKLVAWGLNEVETELPTDDELARAAEVLEIAGFTLIERSETLFPYTGQRTTSRGVPYRDLDGYSWYSRFFDFD